MITDRVTVPFKDIKGLFSYDEVEDLYNYLIVNGTTASTYSPNKDLKRGEFSAMLARALELSPKNENYQFKDVNVYKKEVQALHEAGIITGFPDGSFGESKTLTRQEAAAMIGRMLNYMGVNTRTIEKNFFRRHGPSE
ncbi:S-layer homology domain-containing protein (plasmid) [Lysinibacillus sp. MHQ-1]|nr:S-layer homology domain-containing protein [Lysinibacillus sp. MHQ-1]